jgi:hypothetical protein
VARARNALDRPKLWRLTAALSALLLCGLLVAASQGSTSVIFKRPHEARFSPGRKLSWLRWCSHGVVRHDRLRLAFCARVEGRVLDSTHGPGPGEIHVAVLSDFHLFIFRLPDGSATPSMGARIVAVGPLVRARNGQRELQAFKVNPP